MNKGTCPVCNGKGRIRFGDSIDMERCPECSGSGKTHLVTMPKSEADYLMDSLSEHADFLRELLASRVLDTEQRIKAFRLSAQGATIECAKCPVCEGRSIIHETDNGATPCPVCDNGGVSTDDEPPF